MPQIFPPEIIENTVECYHARISTKSKAIYGLLLLVVLFPLELRKINAGNLAVFLPSHFWDGRNLSLYPYLAEYKESSHRL